jgi:ParB family chromosome partitioning protein
MENKDFDPSKIIKVPIDKVEPNDYNPKEKNTKEYKNVVESIRRNGLKQPIFVREVDGNDKYVVVDGEQRLTAANELGYTEIYVYNLGKISEEEAKALTIWFEVQVPFSEVELAPIVVELNKLDITLPYTDEEIVTFEKMTQFDFDTAYNEEGPQNDELDDEMKTLNIKMTPEQFETVDGAMKYIMEQEDVSAGRALELLCANGLTGYPFDDTAEENL